MMNKKMALNNGYAHVARAGLKSYLREDELLKLYTEKIMTSAEAHKCDLTKDEVAGYVSKQMHDIDKLWVKNDAPVQLRFAR